MDKATSNGTKIQEHLKTHDYIINADLQEPCGVSAATVTRILSGLIKEKAEKIPQ